MRPDLWWNDGKKLITRNSGRNETKRDDLPIYAVYCGDVSDWICRVQDWLEVNVSLRWECAPFLLYGFRGVIYCANTFHTFFCFACAYMVFITVSAQILKPVRVVSKSSKDGRETYFLETHALGILQDTEMVQHFLTQQLLKKVINQLSSSLFISIHHDVLLTTVLGMCAFFIRVDSTSTDSLMIILVVLGLIACFLMEIIESQNIGQMVESTEEFVQECGCVTERNSWLGKASRSFPPFLTLQMAWPFFMMDRGTFPKFCEPALNLIITVLAV